MRLQSISKFRRVLTWSLNFSVLIVVQIPAQAGPATDPSAQASKYSVIGPWTLSAGFPQGGSVLGSPALSLRNEVTQGEFVTAGLNFSLDRQAGSESAGGFLKWNHMLSAGWGKSFPYAFVQSGLMTQKASQSSKKETSLLAAAGIGVEITLLREISTSLETGIGGSVWPSERLSFNAATTQIAVHYHFDF